VKGGSQLHRPLEGRRRIGRPAKTQIGNTEVMMRLRTVRVESRDFLERVNCIGQPSGIPMCLGCQKQGLQPLPGSGRQRGPSAIARAPRLAAVLEFLAAAAGAQVVAADFCHHIRRGAGSAHSASSLHVWLTKGTTSSRRGGVRFRQKLAQLAEPRLM
jgi:hypothetical protein